MLSLRLESGFMKTVSIKPCDIKKQWVTIDVQDRVLGRVAADIARVLKGKHKPNFVPHLECGDNVIVLNADKIKLTGNKWEQKKYYKHSGYVGGLKSRTAADIRASKPEELVIKAVKGMLPKNKLSSRLMENLRVYTGSEHPHSAQKPTAMTELN